VSRLLSSRAAILAALEAAAINSSTTGAFSAPCVLVEAGDPWASVDVSLGRRRLGRWRLTLVAGRSDAEGIVEKLADLVDQVDAALLAIPGVQLPTWGVPYNGTVAGATYAVTSATIQTLTEEDPTP
jgi:hypothetical protein